MLAPASLGAKVALTRFAAVTVVTQLVACPEHASPQCAKTKPGEGIARKLSRVPAESSLEQRNLPTPQSIRCAPVVELTTIPFPETLTTTPIFGRVGGCGAGRGL